MPALELAADQARMEIVAVGIVMIEASVLLLVWAFPKLPARQAARRSR